jgi:ATP-binding cassette subfamily C protein
LRNNHLQGQLVFTTLVRDFLNFSGWNAGIALLLIVATSALEGVGLLMLVPLLYLLGIGGQSGDAGFLVEFLQRGFQFLHIELTLPWVLIAYVLLIMIHAVLNWVRQVHSTLLQQRFIDYLRLRLFAAVGCAEWAFLAKTRSADFSHSLTSEISRSYIAIMSIIQIIAVAAVSSAYLVAAVVLSPALTLMTIIVAVLLLLLTQHMNKKVHRLGEGLSSTTQAVHAQVIEFLAGLKLAKSGNAEVALTERFAENTAAARENSVSFTHFQAKSQTMLRVGAAVALALFAFVAIELLSVPAATVLVLAVIFSRIFPNLAQLQQHWQRALHSLPAYVAYRGMLEKCETATEATVNSGTYIFVHDLTCDAVGYSHEGGSPALEAISLTIPACTTAAIVGPSGAGKSTLADILSGLLAPTQGAVRIDGRTLNDRRTWRDQVAYVPQETFLFNTSIRDNLQWTVKVVNDDELWAALDLAAADFVRSLPEGLDTVLGERGIRLSGGERQRIAIARALLRKPKLLVLDEATSALDSANEKRIQSALERLHGNLTILIIAHRLSTVRDADQVLVLDQGKVVEQGSYQDLMDSEGSYLARNSLGENDLDACRV